MCIQLFMLIKLLDPFENEIQMEESSWQSTEVLTLGETSD